MRKLLVLAAAVVLAVSGCGGGSADAPGVSVTSSVPTTLAAVPAKCCSLPGPVDDSVIGLVAIGHSGLTGYVTDEGGFQGVQNSWATGTNPAVRSIFSRLVMAQPDLAGHVANTAVPGSGAAYLEQEVIDALARVPYPQLVVIQDIGNDIRCDGTDSANYKTVGLEVRSAFDTLRASSPKTRILVLSQLGTPASKAAALAGNAAARAHASGTGMCSLFNSAGVLQEKNIARLDAITAGYEHEFAVVCAQVPQCTTDNGLMSTYTYRLGDLVVGDWDHLKVSGQARLADLMWPVVAKAMNARA